jgi:two-component system chemotaxis response regulator CheY
MLSDEAYLQQLPRLLVVDDDHVQRTIIYRSGLQSGFDVDTAATLQKANQLVCERKFDCVTIDLGLGPECGLMLLQTLSEQAHLVPIIVISGACKKMLEMTAEMAQSLGFDSHIMSKPLNLIELRDVLDDNYRNTSIRRSLESLAKTADLKGVERQK